MGKPQDPKIPFSASEQVSGALLLFNLRLAEDADDEAIERLAQEASHFIIKRAQNRGIAMGDVICVGQEVMSRLLVAFAICGAQDRADTEKMICSVMGTATRTSRGTRTDSLKPSSQHWSNWATALRLEYSVRPKPEIPCGASDCSSWPAPQNRAKGGGEYSDPDRAQKRLTDGVHQVNLSEVAITWAAPRCNDPEKRGQISDDPRNGIAGQAENWEAPSVAVTDGTRMTRGGDRSNELLLTGQAVEASKTWAAPAAQNHKGSSEGSSEGSKTRADGKSREDILSYQAEQFFRPPSSLDHPIAGGSTFSTDGPNSNQPSVKRKLNPIFVEALMRWPTGLSGFERQEMVLIPSRLPMLICVCKRGCQHERDDELGSLARTHERQSTCAPLSALDVWWLLMPSYLSALCSRPAQATLF